MPIYMQVYILNNQLLYNNSFRISVLKMGNFLYFIPTYWKNKNFL